MRSVTASKNWEGVIMMNHNPLKKIVELQKQGKNVGMQRKRLRYRGCTQARKERRLVCTDREHGKPV